MSTLSSTPVERSRKAHAAFLLSLKDDASQVAIAAAMGVSQATVSRIKNDKVEDALVLLYHAGFKVVGQDMRCYPIAYVEALHTMARMHMGDGPRLEWDE